MLDCGIQSGFTNLGQVSMYNRLDLLQILYNEKDSFLNDNSVLDYAGNIEIVEYLSNLGASCTTKAMNNAALHGRLQIIQLLHLNRSDGCTSVAMDYAALHGRLQIIQLLHLNRSEGCTSDAMNYAAKYGYLDIVKWLHLNRSEGCSVSAMVLKRVTLKLSNS